MRGKRPSPHRRLLLVLPVVGVMLAVAAVAQSSSSQRSSQKFDGTIKFGTAMSLTGALAAEARTSKDGYDFMINAINKKGGIPVGGKKYKVELVSYDDQSSADTAVRLYEKLINEDHVNFLLGPYSSGVTLATSTIAEKYKLPMVVAHAATPAIYERGYKYLFGTLNTIDYYSGPILKMASEIQGPNKPKTVALINENALAPTAFVDAAERQAKALGFEVVYKQSFPRDTDLSSIISAIKDKKPDILFAGGYTAGLIQLVRYASEQKLRVPMWAFLLGPTVPGFLDAVGRSGEYLLEPIQWSANMPWKDEIFGWTAKEFSKLFFKQFGYLPDYHPPQSAAALEVYYKAIQKAGSLNPQKVRDQIAKVKVSSFYGTVCFNSQGKEACKSTAVAQIQGGRPVVVYPKEFAQRKLIYPAPGF